VGHSQLPDGSPDNAPHRAQGIILIVSPVLFVLLIAYFLALGGAVRRWRIRRLRIPLFVNLLVAVALGLFAGVSDYREDDIHTVPYSLATSFLFFASLCFGSGAWWILARRPTPMRPPPVKS
jgi:hypothetical protein